MGFSIVISSVISTNVFESYPQQWSAKQKDGCRLRGGRKKRAKIFEPDVRWPAYTSQPPKSHFFAEIDDTQDSRELYCLRVALFLPFALFDTRKSYIVLFRLRDAGDDL